MSSQTKLLTKFENLPYFTKKDLAVIFTKFAESETTNLHGVASTTTHAGPKSNPALNRRITRLLKNRKLLQLKKGLYTTGKFYFTEPNKAKFTEFLSSAIYTPSYLSLEYVLKKHNLLAAANPADPADPANTNPTTADPANPTATNPASAPTNSANPANPADPTNPTATANPITCVTTKTTRSFKNPLGNFRYSNIKPLLFCGFKKTHLDNHEYHIATKAKALFDYLYLKPNLKKSQKHLRQQLFETSGIIWTNFSKKDFEEFDKYVWKSNSKKMMDVWHIINKSFASKDFDRQIKELLAK